MTEEPKIGSMWKAKDPAALPMAVPRVFLVDGVEWNTAYLSDWQKVLTVRIKLGNFYYYLCPDEMAKYEEVTDEDEIGWQMLRMT